MSNTGSVQRLPLPARALALVLAGARRGGMGFDGAIQNGPAAPLTSLPPLPPLPPLLSLALPAPPAHFGGKFRTVDFALSNCLNSGVRRIAVLTPGSSHSLHRHLARSWAFLKGDASEFVQTLPLAAAAAATPGLQGAAFASARCRELIVASGAEFVLVLSGNSIYKMNCATLLADHLAQGAACTVACITAPPGIVQCLGACVFNARFLLAELDRHSESAAPGEAGFDDNFACSVQRVMAQAVHSGAANVHHFAGSCVGTAAGAVPYWRDMHNLDAYWQAHIELTGRAPPLDLYDPNWPMRAQHAELAPAKFLHNEAHRRGSAVESLVSGGSIISGSVLRSVLFSSVRVHSYAQLEDAVLLPAVQVGRYARLKRVVVDSACTIPEGLVVGEDAVADAARFFRSEQGITFVTADRLARLALASQRASHTSAGAALQTAPTTERQRAKPCATS